MYIENINSPADVKKLNIMQLNVLAEEMRHALLTRASKHGGHFGPNFGMVEAIIAMHYVFDSPKDKIVFDVSTSAILTKCSLEEKMHIFMRSIMMMCQDTLIRTKVNMISLL